MGEKKIKRYVTFDELAEIYGWTKKFFYKHSRKFRPALLKIDGHAPKPYKFDLDVIEQLLTTAQPEKRERKKTGIARVDNRPEAGDDLWL